MIQGGVNKEVLRPKSSQRGAINAWYIKVRENIDFYNQNLQNPQPITFQNQESLQPNIINQTARISIQSQGNSRSGSNLRQTNSNSLKYIPQQQFIQQNNVREQPSPQKKLPTQSQNIDNAPFPQSYQKQKRPPSQLMHILQNQKKNIRQLYALQLSGNMQSEEKHRNQMREIKEKLLKVSQERNKKISSLIYEENRNNNNVHNLYNSNQLNQNNINNSNNTSQLIQKQNSLQDVCRNSLEFSDNKFRVFADYQNYLGNNNSNNNNNIQGNNNLSSYRAYNSQLQSQNSSTTLTQSQQRINVPNIPSQPALNKYMKQSLQQIQHGITQSDKLEITNQNIINAKRAQVRDQYSQSRQLSQRESSRTQSMICTQIIGPLNRMINSQSEEISQACFNNPCDYSIKNKTQQEQNNDQVEDDNQQITMSSFLNGITLETEVTPTVNNEIINKIDQEFMENTASRKIRQISNPTLRKKYTTSSELLMKNFLKKQVQSQRKPQNHDEDKSNSFTNKMKDIILTDQPKREKRRNQKQMSVGNFNILRGTSVDHQIINGFETPTPSQITNLSSNLTNFNDYYYNHQMISMVNRKCISSSSPAKRANTYESQLSQYKQQNTNCTIKQQTVNLINGDSPREIYPKNNLNNLKQNQTQTLFKLADSRPSSSLLKSHKDQVHQRFQSINLQKQGQSPSGSFRSRPTTAKIPNIASIASQASTNIASNYQNHSSSNNSPLKNKIVNKPKYNEEHHFNFADLNSWDTSRAEEQSEFELI